MKTVAELRDWLDSVLTVVFGYLAWRWRPRQERRDVTIKARAASAIASMPTAALIHLNPAHGTSSASLALTTGHAGTQAVLDSMAELDPDFPHF